MSGHLWYLAEQLVALAFFDRDTTSDTKRHMVAVLRVDGSTEIKKRTIIDEEDVPQHSLDRSVKSNKMTFFHIIGIDPSFHTTDPEDWIINENYCSAEKMLTSTCVINNVAERGVALMERYFSLRTCHEEQKQYLLHDFSEHHRRFPDCRKETLTA